MKNAIRLALLCSAAATIPAFGQDTSPRCGSTNFDPSRSVYTVMNPAAQAVNQQCFITVYPSGSMPSEAQQSPASYLVEGRYTIELSGGGGGGGGGSINSNGGGGGGGGAGASPMRIVQYLAPGVYKMTIGTGGEGGTSNGGWTWPGNPTSLTDAYSGRLVAGFEGADRWTQRAGNAKDGRGGIAEAGGSSGGNGRGSMDSAGAGQSAQSGSMSQSAVGNGRVGQAGSETARSVQTDAGAVARSDAGGGGGSSLGNGGNGESANGNTPAGVGNLGGGGGGGVGGISTADAGGRGGDGFIRLSLI